MGTVVEHGLTGSTPQAPRRNASVKAPKTDGNDRSSSNGHSGNADTSRVVATDDEILGITSSTKLDPRGGESGSEWEDLGTDQEAKRSDQPGTGDGQTQSSLEATLGANPELKRAWDDARAYRESFRTPAEARTATAALADLHRMDALFFSGRAQDHAELARAVASLDPAAFRSLAQAMSEIASQTAAGPDESARSNERQNIVQGAAAPSLAPAEPSPQRQPKDGAPRESVGAPNAVRAGQDAERGFTPAQQDFLHSTNAAAVGAVIEAIESQVERLLPEEISKGARNRLVGEIYRELDTSLRSDRQFARQARDAFRSGALDDEHRRAVVSLVNSRARQALPAVARRVLSEWTSAIVAANQGRRARQQAAERRVDIAGSGRTGNDASRPVTPKDINYARMSDADILNL